MSMTQIFLQELENESVTTRKMLAVVPNNKFNWKPHEKSMAIQQLATHVAELPNWVCIALTSNGLDFATSPYKQETINSTANLLSYFEKTLADGKAQLEAATDEDLLPNWTMRNGNEIYSISTRAEVIRMTFSQIIHHRAQLGVYLRLLNIPIPGSYGPSADEQTFNR